MHRYIGGMIIECMGERYPKKCQVDTWLANWPELIFSTRARGATRKKVSVFRDRVWVDWACLEMEGKVCLKLWIKLGVPRNIPK